MASALEGNTEGALVTCAGAGLAARLDLGALREIPAKASDVLIVDICDVIDAEGADLAARNIAVASARASAATARATPAAAGPVSTATTAWAIAASSTATAGPVSTAASAWAIATAASAAFAWLVATLLGASVGSTAGRPTWAGLIGGTTITGVCRCGRGRRNFGRRPRCPVVIYVIVISHFSILFACLLMCRIGWRAEPRYEDLEGDVVRVGIRVVIKPIRV